jgi:hypothetical protein
LRIADWSSIQNRQSQSKIDNLNPKSTIEKIRNRQSPIANR